MSQCGNSCSTHLQHRHFHGLLLTGLEAHSNTDDPLRMVHMSTHVTLCSRSSEPQTITAVRINAHGGSMSWESRNADKKIPESADVDVDPSRSDFGRHDLARVDSMSSRGISR